MELQEVEQKNAKDVMFKRIGMDVPMLSKSEGFAFDQLPARGLAVSNLFGCTFFVHSRGFSIAKTADLLALAEKLNDKADGIQSAQEAAMATVNVPHIRVLALSSDELTVGVCAGGNVMFHELAALVHKSDTRPFEVRTVDDAYAKDFSWSPSNSESYLILTNQGKLLLGRIGSTPECKVEKGVATASWSADGQHIAYVAENCHLSITSSNFTRTFQVQLPVQLTGEDNDSDLHVDAIRWVRPDSIIVGYVRVNSEGEEDEYPLFVLNSRNGNLAKEDSKLLELVFYQLFPSISIDSFVVPSGSGPYMLTNYVKPWELVVATTRKSTDNHIVLLGWLPEDGREVVYNLEIENDLWMPRIELQESDDDNTILGLAIDCTTVQTELTDPRDETGDSMLPPYPVLICLTLEGKLSFFTFARLDEKFQVPGLVTPPSNVPDVKRPVPKALLQPTPSHDTRTRPVPFSPAVVKVEQPKDVPASSGIKAVPPSSGVKTEAKIFNEVGGKGGPLKEGGTTNWTKVAVKEEKNSLFERLTTSTPFIPQGSTGAQLESSRLGYTNTSQDVKKSTSLASSGLDSTWTGHQTSDNLASTYQELFRPFNGAPKSGSVKNAPPPQVQWGSNLPPVTSSLPGISSTPFKTVQTGLSPTPNAAIVSWGKGLQGVPAATATVPSSSSVKVQLGASAAAPKVTANQRSADRFTPGSQSRTFQDQLPSGRTSGVTDMEVAFIAELEKVKKMSEEVDHLMSHIEGKWQKFTKAFTKQTLEELEHDIHLLSEDCKLFRRNLNVEKQNIEDLRDEEIRVDAWRIYAQSLMQQKNDCWHQELWTRQKLHPELEMKRKRVLRADQDLKLQIAELEGHLHNLELKQWQQDSARRRFNKQIRSPGQFLSVSNLYNTVNTQMAVAEELSNSLAQQMETLNIQWSSSGNDSSKAAATTILKSVGVTTDGPDNAQSPFPRQRLSYSPMPNDSPTAKGINRSSPPSLPVDEPSVQETTRRRRDSMDAAWVNREAPTTTIKRIARSKPSQGFSPSSSSMLTYGQGRHNTSADVPSKENSQSRHLRPSQSTRMGLSSATPNFPTPTFEGSVSSFGWPGMSPPHWPSLGPEQQQIRPGSTVPSGEPTGSFSGIHFSPAAPAISNNSQESLFKWASNAPVTTSKMSTNAPPSVFSSVLTAKQFTPSNFDGAGSGGSMVNPKIVPDAKPVSFGAFRDSGEVSKSSFVPFTKSNTAGSLDGNSAGAMASWKSGYFSGPGSLGHRLSSGENPSDRTRVGNKEGNQRLDAASSSAVPPSVLTRPSPSLLTDSAATAHLSGPSPSIQPTGSTPSTHSTGPTPTTVMAGPTQITRPTALSGAAKAGIPANISMSFQSAQIRKADKEPHKGAELFNKPSSSSNDTPVRNFPSLSNLDPSKHSTATVETPGSRRATELKEELSLKKQADESSLTNFQQTNKQTPLTSVSGSTTVIPFDLNSPPPPELDTESSAALFSSTSLNISSLPVQTPVLKPVFVSTTEISSPSAKAATDSLFGSLSSKVNPGEANTPVKTAAAVTTLPDATIVPLPTWGTNLEVETPVIEDDSSSMHMGATPVLPPNMETPSRTATTPSIISSPSSTGLVSGTSSNSDETQAFSTTPKLSAIGQSSGSPFAPSSVSAFTASQVPSNASSPFGQATLWQPSPQQPTQQPFTFPGSSTASMISTTTISSSPEESNEEDMEEEASTAGAATFGGFGGLGLGSSGTASQSQKANPFGVSPFGNSQPFQLTAPTGGQLFRPAAFSLPAAQSSLQQAGGTAFGSGFGSPGFTQNNLFSEAGKGFGSPPQSTAGGFGQPAQLGPGQQALGSALGAFGQTRQVGFGSSFGGGSMGSSPGGGFANATPGGGFSNAATGGGFANAATGGGFAGAAMGGFAGATAGGGFASAAQSGGFAGGGFASAAQSGGFAGGGFGGLAGAGGFQSFAGNQGPSPGFGSGVSPPTSLFTEMRK